MAQLDKLNLEIAKLRHDIGDRARGKLLSTLTPLLTVVIAVGGFLFGIYQFQTEQRAQQDRMLLEQRRSDTTAELEQRRQLQNRIRTDVETLLQFFSDERQTVWAAAFNLDDLKANLKIATSLIPANTHGVSASHREITTNLVGSITDDCDFSRMRDAAFVAALIGRWPDYNAYLAEKPYKVRYILDRYEGAVALISKRESEVLAGIRYDPVDNLYMFDKGYGALTDSDVRHLLNLTYGFQKHVILLKLKNQQTEYTERFGRSLGNSELARQLLTGSSALDKL